MRVFIFRLQVGIRPMAEFIKLISVLLLLFRILLYYRAAFFRVLAGVSEAQRRLGV